MKSAKFAFRELSRESDLTAELFGVLSLISECDEKAQPLGGGEAARNEFARSMLEEKKNTYKNENKKLSRIQGSVYEAKICTA
jgi:hypothetical protein